MTKRDMLLLLFIAAAVAASELFMALWKGGDGAKIRVSIDGGLYGEYSLLEDRVIDIEGELGYNRLVIENGSAYMESADCPDKYCMTYKPIARTNESIICLPHRLVVEVVAAGTDGESAQPDAVTR
ncbi:MAG: NusG domain II-containing protein [Lachnospiraceae bacterium]|nr:NusG domain II-containing protein [Lachnospiraceae bacterium]